MLFFKSKINHKLDKLYLIYNNIDQYNSNIYKSNTILKKIKKKEDLINKHIKITNLLKIYKQSFKKNIHKKKSILLNRILKLTYELLQIEKILKKIEWEEDMIIKTFKITTNNKFSLFNKIYQKFNFN